MPAKAASFHDPAFAAVVPTDVLGLVNEKWFNISVFNAVAEDLIVSFDDDENENMRVPLSTNLPPQRIEQGFSRVTIQMDNAASGEVTINVS